MNLKPYLLIGLLALSACGKDAAPNLLDKLETQQLKGHWTIINYWASWCKPCLEEMPELNAFYQQQQAQPNNPAIQLFAVNFDGLDASTLRIESNKLGVEIPLIVKDPSTLLGISKPTVLPTTLIISPNGELKTTLIGPQTQQSLRKAIGLTTQP